jgi:hypothetical protein
MRKSLGLLHLLRAPVNLRTLLSAIAIFSSILTTQASADYIYNIVDHPTVENGWTLSGQITTTVDTGNLTSSDITSWSWSATQGAVTWTANSTGPQSVTAVTGTVLLTPTAITLPSPPNSSDTFNVIELDPDPNAVLRWERGSPAFNFYADAYLAVANQSLIWYSGEGGIIALDPDVSPMSPWLIATAQPAAAPEPASITLLVSGFFAIGGFGIYRRRRGRASESNPAC